MTINAALPVAPSTPPGSVHSERISLLRQRMHAEGLAAMVLTSPENVYYLTGLDHLGYFAVTLLVLPASGEPVLITRAMETPTVRAQLPWCRHVTFADHESPGAIAAQVLAAVATPATTVGLDQESMYLPVRVADDLRGGLPGVRWQSGSPLVAEQRAVKSPEEIGAMRRAARISDRAMAAGITAAAAAADEREVAAEVYRTLIAAGSQPPGFAPLIRSTDILDQEHVSWSHRRIRRGQGLFFELSASVDRYHAPLSRTVYLGHAPRGAAEAADAAMAGHLAARTALHPGAHTGEVYAAWQHAVAGSATPTWPVRHHCGYLVGIGFPPSWVGGGSVLGITADGRTEIRPGMTFHLMSWVTHPVGHVVSDTVLVTDHGAQLLTETPRDLTVLP